MSAKKTQKTKEQRKAPTRAAEDTMITAPRQTTSKNAAAKPKKSSALDAAFMVLAETAAPMNCQALIEAMPAKGYWSSPAGKTPAATLYSALQREITTKGTDARFQKTERGKFAVAGK